MKKQVIAIILLFILLGIKVEAQLSTKELPVSFSLERGADLFDNKILETLPRLDMVEINQEDMERKEKGLTPRLGYVHKVHYDLNNSGKWNTLANGDKIWQLDIYSPEASSINLTYDKFWLPEGAKFFIYRSDKTRSIGAFTSVNNKGDKENPRGFATALVSGDKITLEYYVPDSVKENGIISIDRVVHRYRNIALSERADPDGCLVNVNCSEGQNWQNEKHAVVYIEGYDEKGWINRFTGFLVNTTANDTRPLVMTAHHCLENLFDAINNPVMDQHVFYWNFESPTCIAPDWLHGNYDDCELFESTTGAIVVANDVNNGDFALLRLTENPKNNPDIYLNYLGWDATGNPGTGGGVGISHPHYYPKKIATYSIPPPLEANCVIHGLKTDYWAIDWIVTANGHSVIFDGSSGSPLINNNHRVIGQLSQSCNLPWDCKDIVFLTVPSNYGKLSVSWNSGNVPQRRLKEWLDPINTGVLVLDGCITSFTDQTVTANKSVVSCDNLRVKNVTVSNDAKLTLNAPGEITINGNFEVQLGSQLEIKSP